MTILVALALFGMPGLLADTDPGPCPGSAERTTALVRQVRDGWPLRDSSDPVFGYVKALAGRLIRGAEGNGDRTWRFDVVRNLSPNAFAIGDGYVVVTDGLLAYTEHESQLAAVLAHEMGHILEGHFCRPTRSLGEEFRIGSLVQHYETAAEEQADTRAVDLLRSGGFDPDAMAALLRCLAVDNPGFRQQLERRVKTLERSTAASSASQTHQDSTAFRKARQAVLEDLDGVAPASKRSGSGRTCR